MHQPNCSRRVLCNSKSPSRINNDWVEVAKSCSDYRAFTVAKRTSSTGNIELHTFEAE